MMEVRIDGWQKAIRFSSAHATLNLGKCERLHGHTYAIHAVVRGELESRRVVFDFVALTRALKAIADDLDHYVLVPTKNKELKVEVSADSVTIRAPDKTFVLPKGDCCLLPIPSSTAEDLVAYVMAEVRRRVDFPATVHEISIGVDEGYGQGAWTSWSKGGGKK